MCGIAGYVSLAGTIESCDVIRRMTRCMRHRGPDDEGLTLFLPASGRAVDLCTDETAPGTALQNPPAAGAAGSSHTVAFGHRRFSIVDLSPAGHQPFWSRDGNVCVAFNGEIYNYIEVRRELVSLGHVFRTRCDTEVLVESYRRWGTGCFQKFVGFWAVSLYDSRAGRVLIARDRVGKAPLYIARHGGKLLWASEINSILAATGRQAFAVREQAVVDFVAHSWRDVGDETLYRGITTFPAGSYGWIANDGTCQPEKYWSLPTHRLTEREISVPDAIDEFRRTFSSAVAVRLRADVPIGFELSGGVDSSCVAAAAVKQGASCHAYTVAFPGTAANEEPFARQVYERYRGNMQYTVLDPPDEDFWLQADEYVGVMAEPFHAPNVLTNRNIWKEMSRRGIRVSLNGAAGDESWAGYFNDYYAPLLQHLAQTGSWNQLVRNARLFGQTPHPPWSGVLLCRIADAFRTLASSPETPGFSCSSMGSRSYVIPHALNPLRLLQPASRGPAPDLQALLLDLMGTWRMNYWLRSGNQSFMSVPTEVRCPFLDHRLLELAFRLPVTYLVRDGWLKWLPRAAMADDLPHDVVWRKRKMGFPFPYEQWAAASRDRFFSAIAGAQCPYIDDRRLRDSYNQLAQLNPLFLWRIMSVCLWWKKCVLGESLN